jgi:hypothetical protein
MDRSADKAKMCRIVVAAGRANKKAVRLALRKERIRRAKGEVNLKGAKGYKKELQYAEMMLRKDEAVVVKVENNKVPFRVDSRTVIFIDKDATKEYKIALRNKYAIDHYVDTILEPLKMKSSE